MPKEFVFPALAVSLANDRELYAFPIDGKKILDIASVSRIHRTDDGSLEGFQRDAVRRHVEKIARYIESPDAMIPNAIVIAFDHKDVRFEPLKDQIKGNAGNWGSLFVPNLTDQDETARPGLIIDGQQRTFAIKQADTYSFPVMVCAFIESNQEVQALQFVNVNNVKRLPRTLINELLPLLSEVPEGLEITQAAAILAEHLGHGDDSPLNGLVKSHTSREGVLQLNSLVSSLERLIKNKNSFIGGHCDAESRLGNVHELIDVLKKYWTAIREVFPQAWGLPPKQSRLMHGAGVWAMMHIMDTILEDAGEVASVEELAERLRSIQGCCHWLEEDGDWEDIDGFGRNEPWNFCQNTSADKSVLTAYLIRKYREVQHAQL